MQKARPLTCSQCAMSTSTTTLQNLMSMMAAMVSSFGLRSVGPKHTPKLPTVIRFSLQRSATLEHRTCEDALHEEQPKKRTFSNDESLFQAWICARLAVCARSNECGQPWYGDRPSWLRWWKGCAVQMSSAVPEDSLNNAYTHARTLCTCRIGIASLNLVHHIIAPLYYFLRTHYNGLSFPQKSDKCTDYPA